MRYFVNLTPWCIFVDGCGDYESEGYIGLRESAGRQDGSHMHETISGLGKAGPEIHVQPLFGKETKHRLSGAIIDQATREKAYVVVTVEVLEALTVGDPALAYAVAPEPTKSYPQEEGDYGGTPRGKMFIEALRAREGFDPDWLVRCGRLPAPYAPHAVVK